jgi:hypothetical protein
MRDEEVGFLDLTHKSLTHSNELDSIVSPLRVILAERRDRNSMYSSINRSSSRA